MHFFKDTCNNNNVLFALWRGGEPQKQTLWYQGWVCSTPDFKSDIKWFNDSCKLQFMKSRLFYVTHILQYPEHAKPCFKPLKPLPHERTLDSCNSKGIRSKTWCKPLLFSVFWLLRHGDRSIHQHLAMNLSWPFTSCHIFSQYSRAHWAEFILSVHQCMSGGCEPPSGWKVKRLFHTNPVKGGAVAHFYRL